MFFAIRKSGFDGLVLTMLDLFLPGFILGELMTEYILMIMN